MAFKLGIVDVDAMLENMSCAQWQEWMSFLNIKARLDKDSPAGATGAEKQAAYGSSEAEQKRLAKDMLDSFNQVKQRR